MRGYLNEWNAASNENRGSVAEEYQARFMKRLEVWQALIAEWRAKYQKALDENQPLPDKPGFEEGEDRFFFEVYFGEGWRFPIKTKSNHRFQLEG